MDEILALMGGSGSVRAVRCNTLSFFKLIDRGLKYHINHSI